MAATTSSTGQVSRLQQTTERLRLESTQLRERLRGERDAVRALRAQHAAELRAERKAARCRRIELEAQLQESAKTKSTTSNASACEQCAKNKAIHEAELRKLSVEFKKKEQQLKGQLNEKGTNINATAGSSISACEQCAKQKALHDAEIRKLNVEFKKKEQQLKGQLNEKALPAVTTSTVASSCEQCAKVKALHEADIRKLNVEFKKKEHQLKGQLNELKKVASVDNTDGGVCQTCQRLNGDLAKQKEVSKDLEERLQKAIDADRLKAADLRAQHEKHVTELSRITRANKHDAHKLLEELKTKDRIIEQLRRSAGKTRTKGEEAGIEHTQMRKLREEVRKNEQPALLPPACDPKPETLAHHDKFRQNEVELNVSIKQRDQMVCGAANEDLIEHPETDTDSAVSSAPSSLSPQPCSPAAASLRDRATPPPTSLSPQPSEGYTTPPPGLWPDLESYDDDGGNNELSMAKRQVRELERALLVTRATKSSSRHVTALSERVRQLEEREAELLRELGDLREQNELLEFRVLELAECPDKSSFSTSTWSVPDHRDVSTATDDVAERLNDEPVRRRLTDIASRTDDLEDKRCLMQVLLLLHGLDELSKRTEPYNVETAMQIYNEREHTPPVSLTSVRGARDRTGPDRDRLVAKVPPFTGRTADSDDDRESPLRSHDSSTSPAPVNSRGTQTEVTEASAEEDNSTKSLNLTAEVRKLDKLRETIDRNGRLVVSGSGCVGGCEQKHTKQLEFYRERVEVLERKLCVYESSGEQQARQLAERLSREVILEAQVKQFTATIHKLQSENSRLEEERCELEEAENDTRLRCQRLEADILQLERSRMSAKRRAKDSRQQATYWESMVNKYEERNYELEERECELRHRLEVMEKTAPAILLFNMWKTLQDEPKLDVISATVDRLKRLGGRSRSSQRSKSRSPLRSSNNCVCESYLEKIKDLEKERNKTSCVCENLDQKIKVLENERQKLVDAKQDMEKKVRALETQLTDLKQSTTTTAASPSGGQSRTSLMSGDFELMHVVQELRDRENQMKKRIEDLEQREIAYMETLQQADDIWADMEKGYKQRISDAEQSEASMRDRMRRLEKREPVNYDELEDAERELAARAERLSRENSRLQAENKRLERELCQCISQDDRAREIEARADKLSSELERERRRSQALEQRLLDDDATLSEALRTHSAEAEALRERLARTANELVHLEVTNGELREEVDTLESKIAELDRGAQERAAADEQVIRGLSQELNDRDKELADMKEKGFAAEAGERLGNALQSVKACDVCSQSVNPVLVDTVEGVRTLCQLMSCQDSRPPDDAQAPCAPSVKASEVCPVASIAKKSAESTCTPAACKAPCAPVSRVSFADQVAKKESADAAALVPVDEGSQHSIEQYDLLTEVMVAGQPEYTSIQARVDMDPEHEIEGVTVMASVTDSGNLELTTESPPGLIEHTMAYTPSGNMEVITGFSPRDSSELDKVPSYFHREEEPVAPDIESQGQEPSLIQPDVASAGDEIQPAIDAEMVDIESARTGLSGEGEEASERKSASFKTDFTAEPTISLEESVPGIDAIQSEIEAEIDVVPQKISFSIESEEVRKSSTGSGGSLVELLKEVTYSAEKLEEIMDRTDESSKKSSGVISPSAKSPSAKSIKSPSEKSSEIKSPSEKSSEIKSPSEKSSEVKAPLEEISGIKSPSEKSSEVKSASEKSSEVLETIAAVKEIKEDEEESGSSVCSVCVESEPSTAESETKAGETPEGTKVLVEDEIEPEQKSELLRTEEVQEVPTKDVCICEPTKDESKIPCACSTASQTVNAPRQKSESALCTCPIGIFPVDLYGQPPGSQQLLCVCTMYKSQQPQQQPQQCMPPNMIQGMSPQQMMQPPMMHPQMMPPQMMPPQPMSSPYYQPYVPCPAYGYPGSSMSYGSPQYPSLQQQAPYQNAQGPQDICDPTCSGKKPPPRESNKCEKYSCPAYEKAGVEPTEEEPTTEEPVAEEPVAEEPTAEESTAEEASAIEEPAEEITVEEGLLEEPPDEQFESAAGTLSVSLEISVDEAKTPSKTSATSGGEAVCSVHSGGEGDIIEKETTPVSSGRSSKGSPSAHSTKESTPAAATPTEESLKESARSKSSMGSHKSTTSSGSKIPVPVSPATASATSRSPKSKSPVLSATASRSPTTKSPSKSQTSKSPQISSPVRSSGSKVSAKASRKSTDSGKESQKSGDGGRIIIANKSRTGSAKSFHGQGCNCEKCQCNPCKDPKIAAHKTKDYDALYPQCCPQCLCEVCRCPNCVDPRKKRIPAQRSGADDVTAADLLNKNILPHTLGLPCDCEECECGPCKDPNIVGAKPGSPSSSETSSAAGIKSVTSGECSEATSVPSMRGEEYTEAPTIAAVVECEIPCPCPPCVCDPCDDPNYHVLTSPDRRRSSVTFDLTKATSDQPIKEERAPSSEAVRTSRLSSEAVKTCESVDTAKSFQVGDRTIEVAFPANRTDIHSLNITQTHPVDCDCPICKCDPCNKIQSESAECDCPICKCDPCKTEKGASTTVLLEPPSAGSSDYFSAAAESTRRSSNECDSAPCPFGKQVQVGDRTIDINYPVSAGNMRSVAVCPSGHPVECQCLACTCGPCSNTIGAGTQTTASGVDAATCPFMTSVKVEDRTINIHYPIASPSTRGLNICPSGHPVDCQCVKCVCDPCSKDFGGRKGTAATVQFKKQQDADSCPMMQSVAVAGRTIDIHYPISSSSSKVLNVCPIGHPVNCQCLKCLCQPCSKSFGPSTTRAGSIGAGVTSAVEPCICGPSGATAPIVESTRTSVGATRAGVTLATEPCICGPSGATAPIVESTRTSVGATRAGVTLATEPCICGPPGATAPTVESTRTSVGATRAGVTSATETCICDPPGGTAPIAESTRTTAESCPMMQSVQVAGRTVNIHYPITSSSNRGLNVCPSGHPVDCQCVKCVCNPCSKSIGVGAGPGVGVGVGTESEHSAECDCKTCVCNPCSDSFEAKRKAASTPNAMQPCDCKPEQDTAPCPFMQNVQVADRSIGIHYPIGSPSIRTLNVCPSGHPVDCQCVSCVCNPCSKNIGGSTQKPTAAPQNKRVPIIADDSCVCKSEQDSAPCPFMQNVQVADRSIGIHYPIGSSSIRTLNVCPSGHPVDCQCVSCVCNPCSKNIGGSTQKPTAAPQNKRVPVIADDSCVCKSEEETAPCPFMQNVQVADRSIGIHYPIGSSSIRTLNVCPSGHPVDCKCVACVCNPCSKNIGGSTQKPAAPQIQRMPVTADDSCICKSKEEPAPCPFMQNVKVADRSIGIHYPIGSSSIRTLNVCPSGHPVDCQCVECICNPCSKNIGGSTQNKRVEQETASCPLMQTVKVADRSIGIHYPIGSSSIRTLNVCPSGHPVDCQCVTCVCDPCSKNTGGSIQKPSTAPQNKRVSVTEDPCICKPEQATASCPLMQTVQVADRSIGIHYPIGSSSIRTLNVCPSGHPVDCQCVTCVCNPCSKESPGTSNLQKVPHSVSCECPQCLCNPCAPPGSQNVPERLPPSKLGPGFSKSAVKSSVSSRYECGIGSGKEAAVRSVAVSGTEDWRNLDSDTLKRKLMGMENEARERANEIAQIRKFIGGLQSQCTCSQNQSGAKNQMAESRSFEQTISGLQCALAFLQEKCRKKDRMIVAFSEELRLRADSCVFDSVLHKIAAEKEFKPSPDFDRITAAATLPKPTDTPRQVMRTPAEKPCSPPVKPASPKDDGCSCKTGASKNVDPSPLALTDVRRISPDSLLLKWDRPASQDIKGYEVEVNGEVKSRIHSAGRNATVLNGLEIKGTMNLSVIAISTDGDRCSPPATAVYEPRPSSPESEKGKCSC